MCKNQKKPSNNLNLIDIKPLTQNQEKLFQSYKKNKNLFVLGSAGTGKTYLSLFLSLTDILEKYSLYSNIIIIRSIVPTREIGFLPGNENEKMSVYETPYKEIINNLTQRGDSYDILKKKGVINFESTSFLRGLTFKDSIVIVDECQSMNLHEIDTIITRIGENSKIIFCGDVKQDDLIYKKNDKSGLSDAIKIINNISEFDVIEFGHNDIIRSNLVKSWIISKEKYNF